MGQRSVLFLGSLDTSANTLILRMPGQSTMTVSCSDENVSNSAVAYEARQKTEGFTEKDNSLSLIIYAKKLLSIHTVFS